MTAKAKIYVRHLPSGCITWPIYVNDVHEGEPYSLENAIWFCEAMGWEWELCQDRQNERFEDS